MVIRQLRLSAAPTTGRPVSGSPSLVRLSAPELEFGCFQIAYGGLGCLDGRIGGIGTHASRGWRIQGRVRRLG